MTPRPMARCGAAGGGPTRDPAHVLSSARKRVRFVTPGASNLVESSRNRVCSESQLPCRRVAKYSRGHRQLLLCARVRYFDPPRIDNRTGAVLYGRCAATRRCVRTPTTCPAGCRGARCATCEAPPRGTHQPASHAPIMRSQHTETLSVAGWLLPSCPQLCAVLGMEQIQRDHR